MSLEIEIETSSREIATDGYEMSVGELMSLYKEKELVINPEFQRYFRWDEGQKTRFIESILLGIPVPPIFVFQTQDGVWELVDGLQRLSTIFEFAGILRKDEDKFYDPSTLEGTKLLPSLRDKQWEESKNQTNGIGKSQQLQIKRARMRVEILKKESDPQSKYELFQRLNTGGSILSEQEVRNCIMLMVNKDFHEWIVRLADYQSFRDSVNQTENAEKRQRPIELALRFFVYRNFPYAGGLDVHEYLDDATIKLASDPNFNYKNEESIFKRTFDMLSESNGADTFRRYSNSRFSGQFTLSAYEAIVVGASRKLESLELMPLEERKEYLQRITKGLWTNPVFDKNSGAGVRGTTRLSNLLPLSANLFEL